MISLKAYGRKRSGRILCKENAAVEHLNEVKILRLVL